MIWLLYKRPIIKNTALGFYSACFGHSTPLFRRWWNFGCYVHPAKEWQLCCSFCSSSWGQTTGWLAVHWTSKCNLPGLADAHELLSSLRWANWTDQPLCGRISIQLLLSFFSRPICFQDRTTSSQPKVLHGEFLVYGLEVSFGQWWAGQVINLHVHKVHSRWRYLPKEENQRLNKNISSNSSFHTFYWSHLRIHTS